MALRTTLAVLSIAVAGPSALAGQMLAPRDIAERTRPAVILVEAIDNDAVTGTGSGFFVAADGTFVTNLHVIEGATALRVRLHTGEVFDNVYFITSDARRDLAILRVPTTDAPFLRVGDDRALAVGDPVWVMGSPLGLETLRVILM